MTAQKRVLGGSAALIVSAALMALAPEVRAEGAAPAGAAKESERKAAELYQEGVRLLQERNPEGALSALSASQALKPSPNTALVKAHALRLLGRRVEAIEAYAEVVRDAGDRVRAGDEEMRSTLADAGRWVALLRAELGEVSVEIPGATPLMTLTIDGKPMAVKPDADGVVRVHLWHEPGRATIAARAPGGEEKSSTIDVAAGATGAARIDLRGPGAPPQASLRGPPVGTWIAWGIGAAGMGMFAAFGLMAKSRASELDACSPKCPESLRGEAAAGRRDVIIANVALGVGAAGLAAGAVVWMVSARARPAPQKAGARAFFGVAPGAASIGIDGVF